ncbi:MAG: hypothetical protein AAGF12_12300 [Myxococcota bacterium]
MNAISVLLVLVAVGCSSDNRSVGDAALDRSASDASIDPLDAEVPDAPIPDRSVPDADLPPEPREPKAADRVRYVVVSQPFSDAGEQNRYGVLELGTDGTLASTGPSFEMGRITVGSIAFTPDGEVGIVAQNDGSLGVFRLDDAGTPTVVHRAFSGAFYASTVVMGPEGLYAYVLDTQFRTSGGGVYRFPIGRDGSLSAPELILPAQLPAGFFLTDDGASALVVAKDAVDAPTDAFDLHRVSLEDPPTRAASLKMFQGEYIVGAAAVWRDQFVLVGDNCAFCGPNQVAVAKVSTVEPSFAGAVQIEDPIAIITSPFEDLALVMSGFGNAVFVLERLEPLSMPTELAYNGDGPALPGGAVMIERGTLTGLILMAENQGVRRIRLREGRIIEDLGRTSTEFVVGAIGVQP